MSNLTRDPITEQRLKTERRRTADRLWTGAIVLVAALVTLSALVIAAAPSPQFCRTCHSVQYDALAKTSHRGIACDQCHTGASTFAFVQSRLRTLDMVAGAFVPGPKHYSAKIESQRCALCHMDDIAKTTTGANIRMNHRAPVEKGWSCGACHVSDAHARSGPKRLGYTMDTCMQCHSSNANEVAGCQTCHTGDSAGKRAQAAVRTPWRVTHGPNWQKTHGMGDLKTCRSCHRDDYCVRCHNINVPHPERYIVMHGRDVLARSSGSRDCRTCHQASSCDNCHGMPMPHADGFLQEHKEEAKRLGDKACYRCHDKQSCVGCHTRHTHPGLKPDWREWLQARPVNQ